MCGGGTGSANDSSNDDDQGSGNSFKETMANIFTPGDGLKYVDGQLTATEDRDYYKPAVSNSGDSGVKNVQVYDQSGNTFNVPSNQTQEYNQRLASGIVGALSGGIPGMLGSLATNAVTQGASGQSALNAANTAGGAVGGLKGLFAAPTFANDAEEKAYKERKAALHAEQVQQMTSNKSDDGPGNRFTPKTPTVPTVGDPSISEMSTQAGQGSFQAIPNPNYDPTDPLSPRFLSNPTYEQLLAYRNSQGASTGTSLASVLGVGNAPTYMAEGGEVMRFLASFKGNPYERAERMKARIQEDAEDDKDTADDKDDSANLLQMYLAKLRDATGMAEGGEVGGNEKTMIASAVSAVKGEMPEEQAAIVLGQFLANYGEDALRDLVDKVQSGELDDTVERFANGEAGEVNGPGDGSGVDDKVPASLEGQQDVLLADGEFVLRKKTADALEKKYGGGFLDAVNQAETDAPRTMREYMAKRA